MALHSSRLSRIRLSRALVPRRAPLPMRLTIDPGTGDVILDYGADLPLTVDMFVTQGASTVTLSLEPPTFVGDVSSPYPSTIVEVA